MVEHSELYSVLCGDPTGKVIRKSQDVYIGVAGSLCCGCVYRCGWFTLLWMWI